ncbi:MAG: hypothetical protein JRI30_02190 [Deltaproteobacteria bacterium]|nr:hypothetical protein [Deltaproteobacteria bacterium]
MKKTIRRACRYLFLLCPYKGTGVVWIIGICQTEIIIGIVMLPFGLEQFGLETCRRAHVESLNAERLRAERRYIPIILIRALDLVSRA